MGISPFVGVQRKPSADEGDNAKEDAAAEAKEDTKDDGNADAAGDEVNEEEDDTSVGVPSVREDPSEEKQSTDAAAADKDSQKSLPQASTSSSSSDASELKLNDSNGDVKEESASESAPSDLAVSESKLDAESSCEEEQIVVRFVFALVRALSVPLHCLRTAESAPKSTRFCKAIQRWCFVSLCFFVVANTIYCHSSIPARSF